MLRLEPLALSKLGLADSTIKLFLRIAPTIYHTYLCFWFTFAFLGGGRSFRLTERRSGLALKNYAKVLLLFQIPKDTVFSYAGAPLSNVRVAFLKTLLFFKIEYKGSGFRVVYKIYRPQNKMHPDFEFSECKGTAFI